MSERAAVYQYAFVCDRIHSICHHLVSVCMDGADRDACNELCITTCHRPPLVVVEQGGICAPFVTVVAIPNMCVQPFIRYIE